MKLMSLTAANTVRSDYLPKADNLQLPAGEGGAGVWLHHWNFSGLALTENPKGTSDFFFPFLSHSECLLLQQHIWALGALGWAKGPLSPGFGRSCVTVSVAAVTLAVIPCSAFLALTDNTQNSPWGEQKEMSLSSSDRSKKGWTDFVL